jgi:long-chain acyl-CoA synthetase
VSTSTATSPAPPIAVADGGEPVDLPDDRGLAVVVDEPARADPDRVVFALSDGTTISVARFRDDVDRAAARLLDAGLAPGERVAVLGVTSYAWAVVDLAVLTVGGVVVPVYPTASPAQLRHLLADSGAVLALADSAEQRRALDEAGPALRAATLPLGDVLRPDPAPSATAVAELARRRGAVRADDLATIVYTSGTTGDPKGCMITHRNLYVAAAGVVARQPAMFGADGTEATTVLALPLSHVFGRTVLMSCLVGGTRITPVPGFVEMLEALPRVEPTFLTLVPYALEKIRKASSAGPATGGRLRHAICGGASLDPSTAAWFAELGITIHQAFGLTESATAVTVNGPGAENRPGTVGRPIRGVRVGIAPDGEVLVAGRNVSPGYWGRPAEAGEGWLHTGDLGALDDDGYLTITGRRKEILVTSGGKNVAPTPLEDHVRLHPLVSACMVVGDGRPHVAALVTLDDAALARDGLDRERDAAAIHDDVARAVDAASATVSRAESIRRFRIVAGDFTVAGGHLTPSMKLKRAAIERDWSEDLEELYS